VLLVTDIGRTRRGFAKRAVEELNRVRANLLGVIVNRVSMHAGSEYYYHYYQSYTDRNVEEQKRLQRRDGLRRLLPKRMRGKGKGSVGRLVEATEMEQR